MTISSNAVPSDRPLRLGVIGLGAAAQLIHLPIIEGMKQVELAGVSDLDEYKLSQISTRYGVAGFVDFENLLSRADPDVVLICTPTNTHMPLATQALRAGMHVIIEKPVARNLDEAVRIAQAAEETGKQVYVAMNHRFRQDVFVLRNFLNAKEFGTIWNVRAGWLMKREIWAKNPWLANRRVSGGGVLMDLGIQMLDVVHCLLGMPPVRRVNGITHSTALEMEVEDTVKAMIEYENGITFQLDCSWGLMSEHNVAFAYFEGTNGSAKLNPLEINKSMQGELVNVSPLRSLAPAELHTSSYTSQMHSFVNSLRGESEPQSTIHHAVETMKLVQMIYQSAADRREYFVAQT